MPRECKVCGCKTFSSRDICEICYDELPANREDVEDNVWKSVVDLAVKSAKEIYEKVKAKKEEQKVTLERAMKVIDDYLNAGYKESRAIVHEKAKQLYKDYYGIDYVNYNER